MMTPTSRSFNFSMSNFGQLIDFIENSTDFWLIKNNDYTFQYLNKVAKYYLGLSSNYEVEGRLVGEMPILCSDYEDVIHQTENFIMKEKKPCLFY